MKLHRDESGQAIILAALAVPCLVAIVGLAVDAGKFFNDRRQIQTAADAAAIAGALNITNGTWLTAAKAASANNGYTDGSNGVTVTITSPSTGPQWSGSQYLNQPNYLEATVKKTESTIFMGIFGLSSVDVSARAVATNQAPGNGCLYLTPPTTTVPALNIQGNASITANDCSVSINDNGTNAIGTTGNSFRVNTSDVGVTAPSLSASRLSPPNFSPAPVTGIVPFSDPLHFMEYPYQCGSSGCTCNSADTTYGSLCTSNPVTNMPATCTTPSIGSNTTLNPGCYNGLPIGNGNLTLTSGVYFINGNVTMNGSATFTGVNVTLIFTQGSLANTSGNETLHLEAPGSTGTFPGILYYQVPSDIAQIQLYGTASSDIHGVFYAPTAGGGTQAGVHFQGTAGGNIYTDFVTSSLDLQGTPSFNSYAALPGGAAAMHAIALVE